MATQLQLRKGTKIQNDAFTGAEAELTYVTNTKGLRIHDGTTIAGFEVPVLVASQLPNEANNYTWYRKYSDGWVEQGQQISTLNTTLTLPVEMADTNYCILFVGFVISSVGAQYINTKTTTSFSTRSDAQSSSTHGWMVVGQAA